MRSKWRPFFIIHRTQFPFNFNHRRNRCYRRVPEYFPFIYLEMFRMRHTIKLIWGAIFVSRPMRELWAPLATCRQRLCEWNVNRSHIATHTLCRRVRQTWIRMYHRSHAAMAGKHPRSRTKNVLKIYRYKLAVYWQANGRTFIVSMTYYRFTLSVYLLLFAILKSSCPLLVDSDPLLVADMKTDNLNTC